MGIQNGKKGSQNKSLSHESATIFYLGVFCVQCLSRAETVVNSVGVSSLNRPTY